MSQRFSITTTAPRGDTETAFRVAVLGVVYAAAIVFAVVFSPAVGFESPIHLDETGKLGSGMQRVATSQ